MLLSKLLLFSETLHESYKTIKHIVNNKIHWKTNKYITCRLSKELLKWLICKTKKDFQQNHTT